MQTEHKVRIPPHETSRKLPRSISFFAMVRASGRAAARCTRVHYHRFQKANKACGFASMCLSRSLTKTVDLSVVRAGASPALLAESVVDKPECLGGKIGRASLLRDLNDQQKAHPRAHPPGRRTPTSVVTGHANAPPGGRSRMPVRVRERLNERPNKTFNDSLSPSREPSAGALPIARPAPARLSLPRASNALRPPPSSPGQLRNF